MFKYIEKSQEQLLNLYKAKVKAGLSDFKDEKDFLDWYNSQEKKCYYCGLKEEESQKIVMNGLLKSNRFPQNGEIGRGQSRGVWLEIDRKNPKQKYSRKNCVLCCYFCNNDKSDVFDGESYKEFVKDRYKYLKKLLGD